MDSWINILAVIVVYLFVLIKKNRSSVLILLISISFSGYVGLTSGLKFIDIISVTIFLIYVRNIKRIGIISSVTFFFMMYQIIVNIYLLSINEFQGSILSCITPVVHQCIPLILIFLVFENTKLDFKRFLEVYSRFLTFGVIFFAFFKARDILLDLNGMKLVTPLVSIAGLVSFISPIYVYIKIKIENLKTVTFFVILNSFIILLLSEVRGALLVYMILLMVVVLLNCTRRIILVLIACAIIISPVILNLIKSSYEMMSIVELQFSLIMNKLPDFSLLTNSEVVRYQLWTAAKDVWFDHFLIGIGTNQFKMLEVLNRDQQLSPHHVIYTLTSDGGLIGLLISLFPIFIFYIISVRKYKVNELVYLNKCLKVMGILYILMGYVLGYTFEFNLLVGIILVLLNELRKDKTINEKRYDNLYRV